MKNIFIGLLFVFLDFNLNLNTVKIELIPDFVGYIIMAKGLVELFEESDRFIKIKPYVTGMAVYTGIVFFMDLLGITVSLGDFVGLILGILSTAISLYISYNIVMGIKDMETASGVELNSFSLYKCWRLLAVFTLITYVIFFIPFLAVLSIITALVSAICFLVAFNQSKNLYYGWKTEMK